MRKGAAGEELARLVLCEAEPGPYQKGCVKADVRGEYILYL